jgi:hypothetical protein
VRVEKKRNNDIITEERMNLDRKGRSGKKWTTE